MDESWRFQFTNRVKSKATRSFGERVRRARIDLGLSQEKLAERASCHTNYIGGIERGERNPSLSKIVEIAVALSLDPAELIRGLGSECR